VTDVRKGHHPSLDPDARCLACDTPVKTVCKGGDAHYVECTPSSDGEWEWLAGHLVERPAGSMVTSTMRYRDHQRHCKGSLRPEPKDVPTRPERPTRIRRQ
jgi:hypothetical protein